MTDDSGIKQPLLLDPDDATDLLAAIASLEERRTQHQDAAAQHEAARAHHEAAAARIGAVLDQIRAPQKAMRQAPRTRRKAGLPAEATP